MHISEFDYELPPALIAQEPLAERDRSRMLIVDRARKTWRDGLFIEFPNFFNEGDVIVINNTRVFPARLTGYRILRDESGERRGARVEVLLLHPVDHAPNEWKVVAKPGRALRAGAQIEFGNGRMRGIVTAVLEEGQRQIRFEFQGDFDRIVDEIGNTPLPPYLKREGTDHDQRPDKERYQTLYASRRGAIAAPTAGLHFTPRIFEELNERGVRVLEITHHVGYATFQPVRVEQIEEHRILPETYEIGQKAAESLNAARQNGNRIIAVGTTTVRALESATGSDGKIRIGRRHTELFIYPSYQFRTIDALLTNFHLPQSSLLMLVSAFAERELILNAYRHAVAEKYRFYSFGDCMLLI